MPDQWEYRTYGVHVADAHNAASYPGYPASFDAWVAGLNTLGSQGWEAVGPVDIHGLSRSAMPMSALLLKRRII
ncbi:hypothetical protein AMIS_19500 [Actinoplanes missouriensis 431]|uniref:DUF4177 domain-containing protein n=1 Tax=Actinoplanes missouriensis (strain ATCC 14538 / DSM 43046 / CBS 188.64 / JCM 3121 / NBRC 102363 / NCIMB 12654 / NRRL B-3342 / UNCC 431) TaxID=512565 RepID=I0H2D3_ACTM4|nr:hypothetical protein [Actinoplanes missouriensis]BAL87170.1 hypothetical protein AMIS_19500 [Actinoplanes missouriensis 431]